LAPVGQVRDTILGALAEAKVNDLMTAAGKVKLKENLLHALQERVPQLGVEEVYFTEFLIQRRNHFPGDTRVYRRRGGVVKVDGSGHRCLLKT